MLIDRKIIYLLFLSVFLWGVNNAYANGIPVIFAVTVFHILIINSLVIAVETVLLKRLSRSRISLGFIILANLASLFLAYILTSNIVSPYFNNQWFGLKGKGKIAKHIFLTGVAVFILLTILIEWVFFHLAQKNNRRWFKSLKYTAIINFVTNIPIAAFYLLNDLYYESDDY